MEVNSELKGLQEMIAATRAIQAKVEKARTEALKAAALTVHALARRYAPISPTQAQRNALRKTKRRIVRKATAHTRAKPGGLTRSIEFYAGPEYASVFVAANAEAGKYAAKIHDEKFKTWRKRGIGTVAKGSQADDKFIERALADSKEKIDGIFEAKFRKAGLG